MSDQPVPVRTEYIGIVDGGYLWRVWRTDTNEPIGWNLVPIEEETSADLVDEAQAWSEGSSSPA